MPDLEDRVAALEAAVAVFARALLSKGDITINDARAAMGFPALPELAEPGFPVQPDEEPLISAGMLQAAADPSLPAGVIAVQDKDGLWWRYPLAEFAEDSP